MTDRPVSEFDLLVADLQRAQERRAEAKEAAPLVKAQRIPVRIVSPAERRRASAKEYRRFRTDAGALVKSLGAARAEAEASERERQREEARSRAENFAKSFHDAVARGAFTAEQTAWIQARLLRMGWNTAILGAV